MKLSMIYTVTVTPTMTGTDIVTRFGFPPTRDNLTLALDAGISALEVFVSEAPTDDDKEHYRARRRLVEIAKGLLLHFDMDLSKEGESRVLMNGIGPEIGTVKVSRDALFTK